MSAKSIETPEQRWGGEQYHLTGEITPEDFFNRLHPVNASHFNQIVRHLTAASLFESFEPSILVVGSSADLSYQESNDIDLLVFPREEDKRLAYAKLAKSIFQMISGFEVDVQGPKNPYPSENDYKLHELYVWFKIFARPRRYSLDVPYLVPYDITFAKASGGSYEEIMEFHRLNRLAFCEIPIPKKSIP